VGNDDAAGGDGGGEGVGRRSPVRLRGCFRIDHAMAFSERSPELA
jgi:hypothetical protein